MANRINGDKSVFMTDTTSRLPGAELDAQSNVVTSDVVVVGGGIGGLTAARALRGLGASVTLLEQAPEFGEVGAGLQLGPNATRHLRDWGMLDRVIAVGVVPENLVFRDAVSGDELTRQSLGHAFTSRYGAPYVVVHRSDLHRILCDAAEEAGVDLRTNQCVTSVDADPEWPSVTTSSGQVFRAGLVLGADGLASTLRREVTADEPVPSGYVAYRGTHPMEQAQLPRELHDVVAWLGPACHFVQYPLRGGETLNQVAVFRSPAFLRGEAQWGGPEELDEAYAGCHPQLRTMLTYLWRDRHWPMSDRAPIETWSRNRLLLTGDAAHPMLQYLAQGACQAIEDAGALSRAAETHVVVDGGLHAAGWGRAIDDFVNERAPRAARVQRTARMWGEMWHLDGVPRLLRNELFRHRDTSSFRYLDWLYGDPEHDAKLAPETRLTG